jgi:hypothetical protein
MLISPVFVRYWNHKVTKNKLCKLWNGQGQHVNKYVPCIFFLSFLLECMCLWPSQATMPQCSPQALKLYKERKIVKIHLHLTSHSAITFVLVYHLQVIHNFHIPLSQLWPAIVTHFCLSPQLQIVYHNWVPYDIVWITHTLSLLFSLFNSNLKRQQKKKNGRREYTIILKLFPDSVV